MFKVHIHVCEYANFYLLLRISLKRQPEDRRIGLLRHAYQQNGGIR